MWTVERMDPARDLEAVVEIEAASFSNPWTRPMLEWELEHSDVSHVFVLRMPETPVAAFCSCWLIFDELHLNNLAVRPGLRGRGLGTVLLDRVLEEAARLGATRATLEVRRSNDAALRLYRRAGFEMAGVRPRYYSNPEEDALVLWRTELAPPHAGCGPVPP